MYIIYIIPALSFGSCVTLGNSGFPSLNPFPLKTWHSNVPAPSGLWEG